MNKYYFTAVTPDGTNRGFQKVVFYLPRNQDLFLIQYIGDELLAVDYPHGNASTEATRPYVLDLMHSITLGKMKLFHADTFVYFVTETILFCGKQRELMTACSLKDTR